jgi:hypothetical protein
LAEGPDGTIYGYARGNEDASPIVYRWTNIAGLEIYASLPQNIDALSSTAPPQIAVARSGEVYLTWEADSSWLPHRVTQSRVISPSGEQQDLPELNLGVVTNPDGDGYGITLLEPGVYYGFRVRPL